MSRALALGTLSVLLCSCGEKFKYFERRVDLTEIERSLSDRTLKDDIPSDKLEESGYKGEWPPITWGLEEFMVASLFFSPSIDLAKENLKKSLISAEISAQHSPISLEVTAEHHQKALAGERPWGLGMALALPIVTKNKRQALSDRAALYADNARLALAQKSWDLRSALRDNLISLRISDKRLSIASQRYVLAQKILDLLEARLRAGYISDGEYEIASLETSKFKSQFEQEKISSEKFKIAISRIAGLPIKEVLSLRFNWEFLSKFQMENSSQSYRKYALRNRIDLHALIIDYGAADADFRIQISNQYPQISLSPGYLWDQGDGIWSLVGAIIPPANIKEQVMEAELQRSVMEKKVIELQSTIQSEIDSNYMSLKNAISADVASNEEIRERLKVLDRQRVNFEEGKISRLDLYRERMLLLNAYDIGVQAEQELLIAISSLEDACQVPFLGGSLLPDFRIPMELVN